MRRVRGWMGIFLTLTMLVAVGCSGAQKGTETKPADAKPAAPAEAAKPEVKKWTPDKPITMIVPYSAGGSTDLLSRYVEKVWSKYSPQPVTVVNKPGSGAIEGREFVVRAKPDGLTFLSGYGSGEDLVTPQLRKLPFDTFADFVPVGRISVHSILVAVPANSQFKTLKEMVEWSKKENKPITSASSGVGNSVDLVVKGIAKTMGANITTVPFAGGGPAVTALVGGQTMMGGGHPSEIMPHVKAGRLRVLGVALPERDPSLPDVPTLKEQGINFYTWGSVKGFALPKGTPAEIVAWYEEILKKISEDPDFKKAMTDSLQPVMYQNAKDYTVFFKQAYEDYGKLIKELDIKLQ